MNRKERIEKILQELDAKYSPNETFRAEISKTASKIYDPTFPEDKLDSMISLLRESYARHYETNMNLTKARNDLEKTCDNMRQISENYLKMAQGFAEINKGLKAIADTAKETLKTLQESNRKLETARDLTDNSAKILNNAAKSLERTQEDLSLNYKANDPKKQN